MIHRIVHATDLSPASEPAWDEAQRLGRRWLRDPAAQEPTRHMPNLQLNEAEARALAAYPASLP